MINPLIIKLGGNLLGDKEALTQFFHTIKIYRTRYQRYLIIIHGGGYLVDELMNKLKLPIEKRNGLRITPINQIDIITGALAGTANKMLLSWAKKYNIDAIGLCLSDGSMINIEQLDEKLGYVGKATSGNPNLLHLLLKSGYIPIISSIGITREGHVMNVNADQAATALATTIEANLVLLSDVIGILDDQGQCISEITIQQAEQMIEKGIITNGMIVKVKAALDAARILCRPVDIASWRYADQLPILFNGISIGTRICV